MAHIQPDGTLRNDFPLTPPKADTAAEALARTGNWRVRKDLSRELEMARASFSAASHYEQERDYASMLTEVTEGIEAAMKLREMIRERLKLIQ